MVDQRTANNPVWSRLLALKHLLHRVLLPSGQTKDGTILPSSTRVRAELHLPNRLRCKPSLRRSRTLNLPVRRLILPLLKALKDCLRLHELVCHRVKCTHPNKDICHHHHRAEEVRWLWEGLLQANLVNIFLLHLVELALAAPHPLVVQHPLVPEVLHRRTILVGLSHH